MLPFFDKMKSFKARVSGSENGAGPAKISLHGFDDAPIAI
jgi:hypothetical protein